ncbi:MAG: PAS domain S-box protein, partial [Anaerolineae bacterium]|nr:PAS domain S-box protein [Anaerolineae bacterium]
MNQSKKRVVNSALFESLEDRLNKVERKNRILLQNEERLRQIIDNLTDIIVTLDMQAHFTYISPSCVRLLGYQPQELLGTWAPERIHPDQREQTIQSIIYMVTLGLELNVQFPYLHNDGSYCWLEAVGRCLLDDQGKETGIIMGIRDISLRRLSEDALRTSEERYRRLVENITDMVCEVDEEARFTYINSQFKNILGYENEDLIGRSVYEIGERSDDADAEKKDQENVLITASQQTWRVKHKNGEWRWVESRSSSYFKTSGERNIVVVSRDITEKKRFLEEINESKILFEGLFNNAQDAILWVNTADDKIINCNVATTALLAYKPEELIGKHYSELFPADQLENYQEAGGNVEVLNRYGKRVPVKLLKSVFYRDQQTVIQVIFHDVSLQKQNEARFLRFERIMASIQDAIMMLDSKYTFLEANQAAMEWLEKLPAEVINRSAPDVMGKDAFGEIKAYLDGCLQGQRIQTGKWLTHRDGRRYYYMVTYTPYPDINQNIAGVTILVRDITSLRLTREELGRSRKRYQDLFENAPLPVIEVDFSGIKIELEHLWQQGVTDFKTYFKEHINDLRDWTEKIVIKDINQTMVRFFNKESKADIHYYFSQAKQFYRYFDVFPEVLAFLAEGFMFCEVEQHIVLPDGDDRWIKLNLVVDPESKDTFERVLISFSDLTGRKHAEEVLRQSEERFRTLFETMSQGVLYYDNEGHILQANPAARNILGISLKDIIGKTGTDPQWRSIYPSGAPVPPDEIPSAKALRTGKAVYHQIMAIYNPTLQNYRWLSVNAIPRFYDSPNRPSNVYLIMDDVTEQKREEQEKEALLIQTRRQTERMDAVIRISSSLRQAQKDEDVLRILTQQSQQGLKANGTLLVLMEANVLHFVAGSGDWEKFIKINECRNFTPDFEQLWRQGHPFVFYNRMEMDRFKFPSCFDLVLNEMEACIFIPLEVLDTPFGILVNGYRHSLDYSDDRNLLATTIGEIAGNTLHRMRVMSSLEQLAASRTRDLSTLYTIISAASGSFDMEQVLAHGLEELLSTVASQIGYILMLDEAQQFFKIISQNGLDDATISLLQTRPVKECREGWVVEHAEPLVIPDVSLDKHFILPGPPTSAIYTYLALPMRARGNVVGVVSLMRKDVPFNVEEITLLSSIADHIGLLVDNLVLYRRAEQAAVLEERSRLARDLHDSATQSL